MPIFSRSSCVRKSGGESISKLPSGKPSTRAQRVRLFFGFSLVQIAQPQPMHGTPTEVPVPRKTNCPLISVVCSSSGIGVTKCRADGVRESFPSTTLTMTIWIGGNDFRSLRSVAQ